MKTQEAGSMQPGGLWALFDNPRHTCQFLLCTLIQKPLKTFSILIAMAGENIVSVAEKGSVLSWQFTTRERGKGAQKKKMEND